MFLTIYLIKIIFKILFNEIFPPLFRIRKLLTDFNIEIFTFHIVNDGSEKVNNNACATHIKNILNQLESF